MATRIIHGLGATPEPFIASTPAKRAYCEQTGGAVDSRGWCVYSTAVAPTSQERAEAAMKAVDPTYGTCLGQIIPLYIMNQKRDWEAARRPVDASFPYAIVDHTCPPGSITPEQREQAVRTVFETLGWEYVPGGGPTLRQRVLQPILSAQPRPTVGLVSPGMPVGSLPPGAGAVVGSTAAALAPSPRYGVAIPPAAPPEEVARPVAAAIPSWLDPSNWGLAEWALALGVLALGASMLGRRRES